MGYPGMISSYVIQLRDSSIYDDFMTPCLENLRREAVEKRWWYDLPAATGAGSLDGLIMDKGL